MGLKLGVGTGVRQPPHPVSLGRFAGLWGSWWERRAVAGAARVRTYLVFGGSGGGDAIPTGR